MIQLVNLTEKEFQTYLVQVTQRYARSIEQSWCVDGGTATFFAQTQLTALLPEGLKTLFHCLRKVEVAGKGVGIVWFSQQAGSAAYIYDIFVNECERNKGYGTATINAVESKVRSEGCIALSLHVFQHNEEARKLYEKLGLSVIGVQMYKAFEPPA